MTELINENYLKAVFNGDKKREDYWEAVEESERMERINSRKGAMELIRERNNNEPENIYNHRKNNLRMITFAGFDQIFNVLSVIGHSKDFVIAYPEAPKIFASESPEIYFANLPKYGNLRNWIFGSVMYDMMFEPNGGILTAYVPKETGFNEPNFVHYEAEDVLDYIENELVILCNGKDENGNKTFLVADRIGYYFYVANNDNYVLSYELLHNIGELPFVLFGGFFKELSNEKIYRSFLSGVCEYWSEALSLNSDLQAVFKNTVFPVKMIVTDDECIGCSEAERIEFDNKKKQDKDKFRLPFQFSSSTSKSPYITHTVAPAKNGEQNPIFPFVAFASPDSSIIETLKAQVKTCMDSGFAAVCMQHLSEIGANQSGIAKEYDRSHLNSFLFKIANHLHQNILVPCLSFALSIRYGTILNGNKQALLELMPVITVPTRFDTLTAQLLEQQISQSKTSGIDNATIAKMQVDFVKKQYENEPQVVQMLSLMITLDPYNGKTSEELINMQMIDAVSKIDLVIHNNIKPFVMRASEEVLNFSKLTYTQQYAVLEKYAIEYIAKNTVTVEVGTPENTQFSSR